jgi:hypothetical protein
MSKKKINLNKDLVMDGKVESLNKTVEKFDNSKSQKGHLTILQIGEYKKAPYMLQKMGDAFQFITYWGGQFYQGYTIMKPEDPKKGFSHPQIVELAVLTGNFMETTVDTLVATKERDELLKKEKSGKKKKVTKIVI